MRKYCQEVPFSHVAVFTFQKVCIPTVQPRPTAGTVLGQCSVWSCYVSALFVRTLSLLAKICTCILRYAIICTSSQEDADLRYVWFCYSFVWWFTFSYSDSTWRIAIKCGIQGMSLAKQEKPSGRQSSALDWHDVPGTAEFGGESPLLFMGFAPNVVRVLLWGFLLRGGGIESNVCSNYR